MENNSVYTVSTNIELPEYEKRVLLWVDNVWKIGRRSYTNKFGEHYRLDDTTLKNNIEAWGPLPPDWN